jgi:hypothetical protein
MNDQFKNFMSVLDAFDKQKVGYILVGGAAVILHGIRYKDKFDAAYLKDLIKIRQSTDSEKKPNKG